MLFTEPVTDQLGMSGGRRPPMEDRSLKQQPTDFRVPSATSNWLRTTYQVDNNASGGGTTTTTRHFAAWEQTTHFPRGHHTHPLLAASASLNSSSPLIRPIPNRLASPPRSPLLTSEAKPSLTSSPQGLNLIKLESRPLGDVDTDGNDSAFEDWETSCSRTTPNNHKSIRKWRQQSQPGGGRVFTKPSSTPSSMPAGMSPISIMTSSPMDHGGGRNSHDGLGGPLSAPSVMHSWPHQIKGQNGSSCYSPSDSLFTSPASTSSGTSDLKRRLKSETVTSPESISSVEDNKPIGIAVGRQRTPTTSAEAISDSGHETSGSSTDKSCSILEDSGIELKRPVHPPPRPSSHVTPGLQLPALSPLDVMMRQPQYWPLQYMHAAAAASASPSQPPPMGTFPASTAVTTKDIYPMYLYNGFGPLAAAAAASMWPSSPAAAAASAFGATPFQQSLIQLQQESWLARHQQNAAAGFLFNQQQQQPQEESSPASSPPRRPTAPPPVIRSPSPVASCSPKENGDHDDNVSVGGLSDELEVQQQHSSKGQKTSGNGSCSSSDLIKVKVESLKAEDDTSGLQLLTEGIDRLEHISTSPSTSSTTSSSPLKPPPPQRPPVRKFTSSSQSLTSRSQGGPSPSKLGLLCDAAFLSDDEAHLRSETLSDSNNDNSGKARSRSLDSPQKKPRTLSSEYRSPKAERNAKAFIASKSLKVSEDLHHLELASNSHEAVGCSTTNMTGIGHGLNNIRSSSSSISSASNSGHSSISGAANGGEVSDRERNLRLNLADIQKKYKEKYKELQVINKKSFSSAAAGSASNGANGGSPNLAKMPAPKKMLDAKKTLAPITPWLHKLKNGTQRISNANNSATAAGENKKSSGNNNKNSADHHLQQRAAATVSASGPDLSTINSKFRSVRPNPFENLLKLSCVGKKSQEGIKKTEQEEIVSPDNANHETPPHATSTPKVKLHESSSNGADHRNSHQKQDLKPLPKLQLARPDVLLVEDHADADVSEVEDDLDNVQPPVLEPMLKPYNSKVAQMASSDSAEINNGNRATSDDAVEKPPPKITPLKIKRPLSSDTDNSSSRPKKSKKEKKSKKSKKERHRHREGADYHHKKHKPSVVHFNDDSETQAIDLVDVNDAGIIKSRLNKCSGVSSTKKKPIKEIFIEGPETCLIKENDLVDGLRVLVKLDGHFHPGKIQAISPPDIYGVLVDKERGNKPHIFCRDEVLQEAIFEVKPASVEALTIGTRVCAYWSQKYHHLYPGTISDMDIDPKLDSNYVNVELDDGDNRDIHVESIRYLPPAYPLVVCDPDPLMTIQSSRRKRRQSWESGTSDGSRPNKTPRASIDEPLQPPTTTTVASTKTSKTSSSFSNVHSGDLKMRINVSQSKQKKSSSNSNSGDHHHRGQQNSSSSSASLAVPSSVASSVAAKVVRKSTNNATLAQRPSISSSSDDEGKCGIASFLPKDQVWKWADKGQKRAKGRTYHKVIQRKKEKLSTGDSAVFLSTNCPDQPYIGRLEYMWETASGAKNVAVRWYYHLAEVDCVQDSDRKNLKKLKQPKGALFESNHYDENDVQTISHRCDVLSLDKFKIGSANQKQGLAAAAADPEEDSNDKYYLAGSHNAVEKTVQFSPGVLL